MRLEAIHRAGPREQRTAIRKGKVAALFWRCSLAELLALPQKTPRRVQEPGVSLPNEHAILNGKTGHGLAIKADEVPRLPVH